MEKIKISIGIPVYNGEKFLTGKILSILNQNYSDFELIISDNGSTDSTKQICEKFALEDKRIRFFSHEKNLGPNWNFNFILQKAEGEYFMWTAVDDKILDGFIRKNLDILEKKSNIVCCASQVKYFGMKTENLKKRTYKSFIKKIVDRFQNLQNYSASGTFESKFRYYLKLRGHHHIFFGMYRTIQLKKILVVDKKLSIHFDLVTMLNTLRFGDIHVIDEILMERYDDGLSAKGFFNYKKSNKLNFIQAISYNYPFTKWSFKNFGYTICLKNLDLFIIWNLEPLFFLIIDIIRKINYMEKMR
jgi:glycosyltransferase involved in cell wall biosynthesis